MNKKIKFLLTSVLLIIAIFMFSNISLAWSPANQTPIYPQAGGYFCMEKGGAVRFTQISSYYKLFFSSKDHNDYQCTCEECWGNGGESVPAESELSTYLSDMFILGKDDITNLYNQLAEYTRPIPSSSYQLRWYNGRFTGDSWEYPYGPKVAQTPVLNVAGTPTRTNDSTGYIFSSGPEVSPIKQGHKKGNYKETESDKADDTIKQYALWADQTYNEGNILEANGLYTEAKEFEEFYKKHNIGNGYNASIDSSKAQVIANRNQNTYIIGPYKVIYSDDSRFSYIEDLLVTANGVTLQPTVIFGSKTSEKVYPSSGEEFFVEFSASATGYPTSAKVNVKFCYIEKAEATYEQLRGKGEIKQFIAHAKYYNVTSTGTHYEWEKVGEEPIYDDAGQIVGYKDKYDDVAHSHNHTHKGADFYISLDLVGYYEAQAAAHLVSSERIWKNHTVSASIDLTMELGGYVWEDADSGKESIQDGKYTSNSEKKIPNVVVTLYKENGKEVAKTKTDANGSYRFSGLNAMEQYSVTFTYNGQYYQPTIFSGSNTWGKSGWKTNSNAKDNQNERLAFNKKFESIGSSPENYKGTAGYNETFSKQDLLGMTLNENGIYVKTREAVIDEFGNLILESSSDATTQKMIQYVKDSLMNAYTFDLYPEPDLFVIDTFQYPSMLTPNASVLYDNAYYINLGLNPREQSDLAIKKDIEKVTLEVNGQEHIYTYDTLENKENAENTWDISLRLSDAMTGRKYYDTNYSREIYTSDYLYKVSDYGTNYADYGKTKADELEVYITYKVMVRNQALSIQTRVDEIVDYYDEDLSYVDERSYIQIKTKENTERYAVLASLDDSKFVRGKSTKTEIQGYNNLYITGLAGQIKDTKDNIIQQATLLIDEKGNTLEEKTEGVYLAAGETAYVYLTFKVNKETKDNEEWVILDEELQTAKEIGVGKENIVEINGYSTRYAPGTTLPNVYETDVNGNIVKDANGNPKLKDVGLTPAGIVDRDSNPGNLNPLDVPKDGKIHYENFEDDTDKAPNIRIKLDRDDDSVRVISGTVFEDERTEVIGVTTTGDGIRDSKDKTLINGVTVQLVELMENGTEFIWRTFENGSGTADETSPIIDKYNLVANYTFGENYNGAYAFKSFMPGKYVVRFIYGDTVRTVTPSSLNMGGLNEKSYNGQDYKSTTYQEGIVQNKTYTWREASTWVNGQETLGKVLTEVTTFKADASNNETANAKTNVLNAYLYDITESDKISNVSDAKDIESRRNVVNDYSDNDVTNYIAEVLASHKKEYQDKSYKTANDKQILLNDLMANTQMIAETGLMVIEFEYDQAGTDGNKKDNSYKIQNVDLGLEERPKAQLVIDKEVTNVKLTLANGSILFDAKNTASNVLWRDHKFYQTGYSKVSYKGGNETEKANFMNYELFGNIQNIRSINASKFGLIQLSMDEELMHGATIEITYKLTVTNVGEVDYYNTYQVGDAQVNMCDRKFYYTGNKSDNAKVVTTRANKVIDYVANNLQFNVNKNSDWQVISKEDLLSQGLVNSSLEKQVEQFNTIIVTKNLSKQLVPVLANKNESTVSVPLVLTQLITSENDSDDLSYRNIVEIVQTSNNVGRRMEYSVVGNQNPSNIPQELDSDIAEVVRILPPFGNAGIYIVITLISLIALGIVTLGIIFIKKKIIKK